MTGFSIAPVPCMRCKARRVKCDKRQPGCARCEKSAHPCPGYNRVRKFLDEGEALRHKIAKGSASPREATLSGSFSFVQESPAGDAANRPSPSRRPRQAPPYSHSHSHSHAHAHAHSHSQPQQPLPYITDGAGVVPTIGHGSCPAGTVLGHGDMLGGPAVTAHPAPSPSPAAAAAAAAATTTTATTTTTTTAVPLSALGAASSVSHVPNPSDLDFDASYFDIDPQVYYANPINCCLLIPDASQADADEFADGLNGSASGASSMLSPINSFDFSAHSQDGSLSAPDETDEADEHETSHLIRYFAEFTSQWLDVFDVERFFGNVVPVRALHSALLKNSLAAVAAKQFGCLRKEAAAPFAPRDQSHWQSSLDFHFDKSGPEWFYKAASFYDKAIGQMMTSLQALRFCCSSGVPFPTYGGDGGGGGGDEHSPASSRSQHSSASPAQRPQRLSNCEDVADDLLAAISVFLLYESLDNRQAELVQHMKGAQYLLTLNPDVEARTCNMFNAMDTGSCPRIASVLAPTKAWQATFWNFAWVDYVVAYTRNSAPHLDTEDEAMWRAAGLPLCDYGDGRRMPEALRGAMVSPPRLMTEATACWALLWIVLQTLDHVASTEQADRGARARARAGGLHQQQQHETGAAQWYGIRQHLATWTRALPVTFEPCVRIQAHGLRRPWATDAEATARPADIPELFYSNAMCATAALLYHLAQMLLMLHAPDEAGFAAAAQATAARRLHARRQASAQAEAHAREVCAIALGQSTLAVRMHMAHPLHLAGLSLQAKEHRQLLLSLLMGIQRDTGYSTRWTVDQLRQEWGWADSAGAPDVRLRRRA